MLCIKAVDFVAEAELCVEVRFKAPVELCVLTRVPIEVHCCEGLDLRGAQGFRLVDCRRDTQVQCVLCIHNFLSLHKLRRDSWQLTLWHRGSKLD